MNPIRPARVLAASALLLFSLVSVPPVALSAAEATPIAKPTFLVVGTFHFEGSTSDLMSNHLPEPLSPRRQKEIEAVVEALARFKPTKIAIEASWGSTKAQEEYTAYRKGEYTLTANEIDQIAYRLAKKLGQDKIYPVDRSLGLNFEKVFEAAAKNGQQPLLDLAMADIGALVAASQKEIETGSVGTALRRLNAPELLDRGLEPYLLAAQVRDGEESPGADLLAEWTRRNLYIYANLTRLIDSPGERVLLLIGAGHAPLLRSFLAGATNLRLEEASAYLP